MIDRHLIAIRISMAELKIGVCDGFAESIDRMVEEFQGLTWSVAAAGLPNYLSELLAEDVRNWLCDKEIIIYEYQRTRE